MHSFLVDTISLQQARHEGVCTGAHTQNYSFKTKANDNSWEERGLYLASRSCGNKRLPVTSGKEERDPKKEGHSCLLCYLREPGKKSTLVSECVVNTVDAQKEKCLLCSNL